MGWVKRIQERFEANSVFYTRHAKLEMENEDFGRILEQEVYEAVSSREVIEEYPEDKPYPSALIFGKTVVGRPLHIVCAYDDEEKLAIIITAYHPYPNLWKDYKRREKP